MKRVFILALTVALLALAPGTAADSDMDEGLDYDFITGEDTEMIPLTPEEKGETPRDEEEQNSASKPSKEGSDDVDDSEEKRKGLAHYLRLIKLYKDDILAFLERVHIQVNRLVLVREHKSATNKRQSFMYGVYDGFFKLQPRAQGNCLTDGNAYAIALKELVKKFMDHGYKMNEQEQFAFEDIVQGYFHMCAWQDTLWATLILNLTVMLIARSSAQTQETLNVFSFFLRVLDLFGLFNAVAESAYFFNTMIYKYDYFTVGKMVAKALKVALQVKLYQVSGRKEYLYDSVQI